MRLLSTVRPEGVVDVVERWSMLGCPRLCGHPRGGWWPTAGPRWSVCISTDIHGGDGGLDGEVGTGDDGWR